MLTVMETKILNYYMRVINLNLLARKINILLSILLICCGLANAQEWPPAQPKGSAAKVCNLFLDASPNLPKLSSTSGIGMFGNHCTLHAPSDWHVDHDQTIDFYVHYKNNAVIAKMLERMEISKQFPFHKRYKLEVCESGEIVVADVPGDDQSGGFAYARCGKYDFILEFKGRKALAILPKVVAEVTKHSIE